MDHFIFEIQLASWCDDGIKPPFWATEPGGPHNPCTKDGCFYLDAAGWSAVTKLQAEQDRLKGMAVHIAAERQKARDAERRAEEEALKMLGVA